MKNIKKIIFGIMLFTGFMFCTDSYSQEDKKQYITTGADICSSYIWRGTKYGTGPAVQPSIEFSNEVFTAGAWGSFDFQNYEEADLYFSFSLPAGISIGMTDYYFPGNDYFDYSQATGSHALEINLGFFMNNFSLGANYILNRSAIAGSEGNDVYFEAKYSGKSISVFLGAGNGWHTTESAERHNRFAICNIGLETTKTISVTDTFNIPVTGQLVLNPDSRQFYIVVGITL